MWNACVLINAPLGAKAEAGVEEYGMGLRGQTHPPMALPARLLYGCGEQGRTQAATTPARPHRHATDPGIWRQTTDADPLSRFVTGADISTDPGDKPGTFRIEWLPLQRLGYGLFLDEYLTAHAGNVGFVAAPVGADDHEVRSWRHPPGRISHHSRSEFAMKLYGIPNCSTVKKARAWLEARDIPYEFHDFKKQGVPEALMRELCGSLGWGSLINRNGPTWRNFPEDRRAQVHDADTALNLMRENASVIKRPILDRDGQVQVGFSEENYGAFFGE